MAVDLKAGKSTASLDVTWDAPDPADSKKVLPDVSSWQILLSPTNSVHPAQPSQTGTSFEATVEDVEVGVTYTATIHAVKKDGTITDLGIFPPLVAGSGPRGGPRRPVCGRTPPARDPQRWLSATGT